MVCCPVPGEEGVPQESKWSARRRATSFWPAPAATTPLKKGCLLVRRFGVGVWEAFWENVGRGVAGSSGEVFGPTKLIKPYEYKYQTTVLKTVFLGGELLVSHICSSNHGWGQGVPRDRQRDRDRHTQYLVVCPVLSCPIGPCPVLSICLLSCPVYLSAVLLSVCLLASAVSHTPWSIWS